jgi:hypothetical protein
MVVDRRKADRRQSATSVDVCRRHADHDRRQMRSLRLV